MPHYKDGTEAKAGDTVKFKAWDSGVQAEIVKTGVISEIYPGSDTCNAQAVHVIQAPKAVYSTINLKDTELLHRPE